MVVVPTRCKHLVLTPVVFLLACAAPSPTPTIPDSAKVDDLYIVDCLLPGQLRALGNTTYMTPRRPVRTTVADCRIRGGEYTAYDRADYKTALKIWLPAAERGEPEAQNTVGEIFEQGLGTESNPTLAAVWYRRAAEQGFKAAQANLATLYETGRGVPKDRVEAMNWYRKAWGISDDELVLKSSSQAELVAVAAENARLTDEVVAARSAAEAADLAATAAELARQQTAQSLAATAESLEQLQAERSALAAQVEELSAQTAPAPIGNEEPQVASAPVPVELPDNTLPADWPVTEMAQSPGEPVDRVAAGKNFGRYFALLVGNSNYQFLDDLGTPVSDIARVAEVLEVRYGFQVRMIKNADNTSVLRALNELYDELGPEDNLLIYYAGHGSRRADGEYQSGYWLPINAEPEPNDTYWVPTEQVGAHLARIKAKRALVIADSAFAGLLSDNPAFFMVRDPSVLNSEAYINLRFPNRARLLMTSGVDRPLEILPDRNNSVFADALIETLERNQGVITAPALYASVIGALESRRPDLDPEFKAIKRAGDEVGDFFFVARSEP